MMALICGITPLASVLRKKNIGITGQRSDAFLNARAARVVETNDGRTGAHGKVHNLANFPCVSLGERAAEYREVLRKNVDEPSIDAAKTGDEAIASRALLLHSKIHAAMAHKFVQLLEGAFVEE